MRQKGLLYLLAVLCVPFIANSVCAQQNMPSPKPFFHAIDAKLDKREPLSVAELSRLKTLAGDKDFFVRAHAVTSLSWSRDAPGKAFAGRVAQSHLKDSEWLVRHAALNSLRRLHSPFARDAAQKMINDSSAKVRESAREILERGKPREK